MSGNFEDFIRAEMPLRQVLLYQPGDPRLGAGYLAVIGAYYLDITDNYKRYVKVGGGDTDWQPVGSGDVSSSAISALSAAIIDNNTNITNLSGDISTVSTQLTSYIDNNSTVINNLSGDISTVSTQLTSYIDNNNTVVNNLSGDISTVSTQLTSYIDNNSTVINNLSGAVTNNNSITNINTSLSSLSAQFGSLSAASVTNISTLVDIDTRLAQFESTIGSTDMLSELSVQLSTSADALSGTPVSCFDTRTYRAAKYVVNASNYNSYVSFEILLTYFNTVSQGRGVQHVVYAVLGDNSLLLTSSCLIGHDAILMFTPNESDIVVNVQRSLVSEQYPTIAYCGTSNIPSTRTDIITLHGPGGMFRHYSGEDGVSIQTDLGAATIAVDNITLGGAPWHFRIELFEDVISLITIPAKYEGMLQYCKVYVKIGGILYAGTPDIETGSVVLEQQNKPAPTCPPEELAIVLEPCDPTTVPGGGGTTTNPTSGTPGGGGTTTNPTSGTTTTNTWIDSNYWDDSNYWSE